MRDDDLVERPLHVQHHGVEAAAGPGVDVLHRPRHVVELADAEGLGEPARRIDGEHDHLATGLGRADRQRRRRRGLADPAGAAADDDVRLVVSDDLLDVQNGRAQSRDLQVELALQLPGDGEQRTLVDAGRVEGDLGQRHPEGGQGVPPAALLEGLRGLDGELLGQGLVHHVGEAGHRERDPARRRPGAAEHRPAGSASPCWRSPCRPGCGSATGAGSPPRSR